MANIKHVALDLAVAVAVAAALGWSASLPRQQVEQFEADRAIEIDSASIAREDVLLADKAVLAGAATNAPAPTKSVTLRYCKSPLSGKPQISTRKS